MMSDRPPLERARDAAAAATGLGVAREEAVVGRILNLGGMTQLRVYVVIHIQHTHSILCLFGLLFTQRRLEGSGDNIIISANNLLKRFNMKWCATPPRGHCSIKIDKSEFYRRAINGGQQLI